MILARTIHEYLPGIFDTFPGRVGIVQISSRMLKMSAGCVLATLRGSTYGTEYDSPLRLLRPCRAAFLNILLGIEWIRQKAWRFLRNGERMGAFSGRGSMILSTTSSLDGKKAVKYLGLVSGDAILGANIFRDFFASVRDIVGGRSAAYEAELRKAKDIALGEMREQARHLGANAIVGIDIDYETIGASASMLMVSASGTAVVVEPE
jgi:uncharacterized protein YbjQ (UPF0145 family)